MNTNVQWCHIVKTKLGSNRIIMGGEVDCVETLDAATDSEREGTVELKTNLPVVTPEDQTKLDIKMLRICMCGKTDERYAVVPAWGALRCDWVSGRPGDAAGKSSAIDRSRTKRIGRRTSRALCGADPASGIRTTTWPMVRIFLISCGSRCGQRWSDGVMTLRSRCV